MLTRFMIAAGLDGDGDHVQRFDQGLPEPTKPIVWRRSQPHDKQWVDIPEWVWYSKLSGYDPILVIIQRDWAATAISQWKAGHAAHFREAFEQVQKAYWLIYNNARTEKFVTVNYEALVIDTDAVLSWLGVTLGLEFPKGLLVENRNKPQWQDFASALDGEPDLLRSRLNLT